MTTDSGADERCVIERELELLDPAVRSSAARVDELLHPDFFEFGSSGRRWDRQAIIDALAAESPAGPVTTASDLRASRLGEDLILVTYVSQSGDRRALRSTLWRRTSREDSAAPADHWLAYFHQGTPIPS